MRTVHAYVIFDAITPGVVVVVAVVDRSILYSFYFIVFICATFHVKLLL